MPSVKLSWKVAPGARLAPGFNFLDPHQLVQEGITGPMIVDNRGRTVWYHPLPQGVAPSNFQVQT
ncbi:MAG: hypothetical protein JST53_04650 [Actinobacteria bacterium]|nr:hypothetical protein [Actinomycetota bacterium]